MSQPELPEPQAWSRQELLPGPQQAWQALPQERAWPGRPLGPLELPVAQQEPPQAWRQEPPLGSARLRAWLAQQRAWEPPPRR